MVPRDSKIRLLRLINRHFEFWFALPLFRGGAWVLFSDFYFVDSAVPPPLYQGGMMNLFDHFLFLFTIIITPITRQDPHTTLHGRGVMSGKRA